MTGSTPADMINLRLILVSGKTKEFFFSPNDSAADIAKHVYDNWPMDWEEEQVSSPNILRLIYQGRFLHGNVTLGGEKTQKVHLPKKKYCVLIDMHMKSQQCVAGKFFAVLIFFLSHRTEVPQCSGQACFDGEREERGNTEREGKETGQERARLALE
uniref:Ubiquitin-like protein 3 n=1 Tax=Sander lucioperca TaxID=283035 RepID=A0A8C9Y5S1_SANLU